jgi:hypothetical protein
VVLGSITLSDKVDGAFDITVSARNHEAAARVATNLNDPANKIFSIVDIQYIQCNQERAGSFKCDGSYRALFDAETKKRFVNSEAANQ